MPEINIMTPGNLANFQRYPRGAQVKIYSGGKYSHFGTVTGHTLNAAGELRVLVECPKTGFTNSLKVVPPEDLELL